LSTATTDTQTQSRTGAAPRSPTQLTRAEWLDVFKRAAKRFLADDCMGLSQQVAFSALLAFLPTVILLIGLLGLFGTGAFNSLEHFVGTVAPHGVISMIDLAKQSAAHNKSGSAIAFVVGVFAALWAASGAMGAVVKAVNRAYDRLETRPFWKVRVISIVLVFALVYYVAPNKEQRSWKWLTPGSLVGSLMWLALSGLFALYTSFSSSYDKTYGSLAGGIILLLWLNYSAWAILFGAELNAELDRQADIHAAGGPQAGLTQPAKRVR
jgi:membrane protein